MKKNEKKAVTIGVVITWIIIISLIILIPLTIAKCDNKKNTKNIENLKNQYVIENEVTINHNDTPKKTDEDYITERLYDINTSISDAKELLSIDNVSSDDITTILRKINQCSKTYLGYNEYDYNEKIKKQKEKLKRDYFIV